jgi:hypothetical protein
VGLVLGALAVVAVLGLGIRELRGGSASVTLVDTAQPGGPGNTMPPPPPTTLTAETVTTAVPVAPPAASATTLPATTSVAGADSARSPKSPTQASKLRDRGKKPPSQSGGDVLDPWKK